MFLGGENLGYICRKCFFSSSALKDLGQLVSLPMDWRIMFLNFLTTYIGKLINKKHVEWVGYNTLKHHIQWNQSLIKNYKIILKIWI